MAPSADLNMDLAHRVARGAANLAWSKVPSLIAAVAANEKKKRQDKADYARVCQARNEAIYGPPRPVFTMAHLVEAIAQVEREFRKEEVEKRRKTREMMRGVAVAAAAEARRRGLGQEVLQVEKVRFRYSVKVILAFIIAILAIVANALSAVYGFQ
ncbi:MAG: hypothetical protein EBY22_16140 [Gammaproteobacteria bacterium]|nr:hypothetical protein [Gammaproteobacteria bacterium]